MKKKYPRDLIGYGSKKIKVKWPHNAKLALQFVLNYEEGSENSVLHGDKYSETFLSEIIGAKPIKGRHLNMESIYEYGSRRGFWRIHDLFTKKKIPLTIFGVGMALERNKEVCKAIKKANYEVASHGWRWIDYQNVSKVKEKKDMKVESQTSKNSAGVIEAASIVVGSLKSKLTTAQKELEQIQGLLEEEREAHKKTRQELMKIKSKTQ